MNVIERHASEATGAHRKRSRDETAAILSATAATAEAMVIAQFWRMRLHAPIL
jgi:hypothetical protein